jgi:hypothetical protein
MEAHEIMMKGARDKLESQYEGRLKDVQGQIVILRDTVDSKQYELNDVMCLNSKLQQQFQQVRNTQNTHKYKDVGTNCSGDLPHSAAFRLDVPALYQVTVPSYCKSENDDNV